MEYWGLVGADRRYEERIALKIERYLRNGVRVVSFHPGDLGPAIRSGLELA